MARLAQSYQAVRRSALDSERLARVTPASEALFYRLLLASDCQGRFHGSKEMVAFKATAKRLERNTITIEEVGASLDELETVGLIWIYVADGVRYLQIARYFEPKDVRPKPVFPTPEGRAEDKPDTVEGQPRDSRGTEQGQAVPDVGTQTQPQTQHQAQPQAQHAAAVPRPEDIAEEVWGPWVREVEAVVVGQCPRVAKVQRDVLLDGLRQALVQSLPPLPTGKSLQDRRIAGRARARAKPVLDVTEWLLDLERRAQDNPVKAWLVAAVKGGPDSGAYAAPGFNPEAQMEAVNHG